MIFKGKTGHEGKRVSFGPDNGKTTVVLELPEIARRLVEYPDLGFSAEYVFTFNGDRLKLDSMNIFEVLSPNGVSTQALTKLYIPDVMREMVYAYNPVLAHDIKSKVSDEYTLAQMYWAEYVCNGSPRRTVMEVTGWSRSNANYHFKKWSDAGLIPASEDRSTRV